MSLTRRNLFGVLPAPLLGQSAKFARSFFFQKDQAEGAFSDFATGSDGRAWYSGAVLTERRATGCLVSTADGGKTWKQTELKFIPRSLFALDSTFLWAVSEKSDVWFSNESGLVWKKMGKAKNAERVAFLDAQRGFAIGAEKTFLRTEDGGKSWRHVPEGAQGPGDAKRFSYQQIDVFSKDRMMVSGSARPDRSYFRRRLPDWMEPELALLDSAKPSISVSLETSDAGKTWKASSGSAFGALSRVRMGNDGQGYSLVKFADAFEYGGELFALRPNQKPKVERVLRRRDLYFHDLAYVPGDGVYVGCTEKRGKVNLPIPTRVRVLHSKDGAEWDEVPVDYRASAQELFLDATPSGAVFAATDNGTVLRFR
jgi:hypothetical protein